MNRYSDIDRDSGVVQYEYGDDYINVRFSDGATYYYNYASAGAHHIERMKILANRDDGLNAYINEHVAKRYARRER